jgi:hypothetical protein
MYLQYGLKGSNRAGLGEVLSMASESSVRDVLADWMLL